MIVFDLTCANGHTFEGWFDHREAFEKQKKKGLISCPVCEETNIEKKLSPFAIKGASPDRNKYPMPSPQHLAELTKQVSEYVNKNFDDVGCEFTKEALKIHYGVSEPRNIKGVSTQAEEKLLKDEGIDFIKVPVLKEPDPEPDKN